MKSANSPRYGEIGDPLIYTRLEFTLAHDMVSCQRKEKESPYWPLQLRPMGAGAWRYTFEANKEIITPKPYTNGLAIPVNR